MDTLLALKYRPQRFTEIVGQNRAVKLLRTSAELRRLFPCYLISGPWGAGKTSIARIFAKAILCERPVQGEPCFGCESCSQFDQGTNPNYSELDSASHGSVDDVRRLRDESLYRPIGGRPIRVVYLDEAGSISKAGNNAFLKLLEEGAESVIFVMTTTDPDNILDTVKSRAFEIELSKLTVAEIIDRLEYVCSEESIVADPKALRLIASYAQGHLRDALMLLDQMRTLGNVTEEITRDMLKVDTKIEFFRLLRALSENFTTALEVYEGLESRLTHTEIWRGLLDAITDVYLLHRNQVNDLAAVEREWGKQVLDQGIQFLTMVMQFMNQTTVPRSSTEVRFNICLLFEKAGKKSVISQTTTQSLHQMARRKPSMS